MLATSVGEGTARDLLPEIVGVVSRHARGIVEREGLGAESFKRALQFDRSGAPESCAVGITELLEVVRACIPRRSDPQGGSVLQVLGPCCRSTESTAYRAASSRGFVSRICKSGLVTSC
jgi:hypothetical protein